MQNYVLFSEGLNSEKDPTSSIIAATTTDEIINDNKDMNGKQDNNEKSESKDEKSESKDEKSESKDEKSESKDEQDKVQELKKEIITTTTPTAELDDCVDATEKSVATSVEESECFIAKNGTEKSDESAENTTNVDIIGDDNKNETVQKSSTTTTCDIT